MFKKYQGTAEKSSRRFPVDPAGRAALRNTAASAVVTDRHKQKEEKAFASPTASPVIPEKPGKPAYIAIRRKMTAAYFMRD